MDSLSLVIAPNPIFKKQADPVLEMTEDIRWQIGAMFDLLYAAKGIGMAAPMVGVLNRIIIVDLQDGQHPKLAMINPEITAVSSDRQTHEEASLCYPGISAEVTRPRDITVTYLDEKGDQHTMQASGWFAQVIQHEIDYLNGKVYLDYLSKMKRDRLLKKMEKYKVSQDRQHQHSSHCGPGCGHAH